jgi:hypothetical protein
MEKYVNDFGKECYRDIDSRELDPLKISVTKEFLLFTTDAA